MVLLFFYIFIVACVLLFVATQVVVPLYRGTKLFPWFRSNELAEKVADLREEVAELTEANHLQNLVDKLEEKKAVMSRKDL